MNALERIRMLRDALPAGECVTLSREFLNDLLEAVDGGSAAEAEEVGQPLVEDPNVDEIMEATGKARSTVHGWITRYELETYKLGGRTYVVRASWDRFVAQRRNSHRKTTGPTPRPTPANDVDLGRWRNHVQGGRKARS